MSDSYSSSGAPAPRAPADRTLSARTSNAQPRRGLSDADAPTGEAKFLAKNKRKKVRAAERNLKKAGFNPGKVDGLYTDATQRAVDRFRKKKALRLPLERHPKRAAKPRNGFRIAAWFWKTHGLNALADRGEFTRISEVINGGHNGLSDRYDYWARAKAVL